MPIYTMLVIFFEGRFFLFSKKYRKKRYWSIISSAVRLRMNPILPVAQNEQFMAHPTCEETQSVQCPRAFCISTDSIRLPSVVLRILLKVFLCLLSRVNSGTRVIQGTSCKRRDRSAFGRAVTFSQLLV